MFFKFTKIITLWYNNEEAAFAIEMLSKIAGNLPPRITGFIIEWAAQHQAELMIIGICLIKTELLTRFRP